MTTLIRTVTAVTLVSGAATHMAAVRQNPVVVFETEKGAIEVEVDTVHAPVTAANFLKYLDGGFYAGGSVNRAVRPDNTTRHDVEIQVIQFQIDTARRPNQFPPIALERTSVTGLRRIDGALSMARPARHCNGLVLHRHRQPAGDGLRRASKPRWSGVRRVWPRRPGDGCGQSNSGVADGANRTLWQRVARAADRSPRASRRKGASPDRADGS